MAKTLLNSALLQLSGHLDGWVYKQYRHGVVVSRRPRMDKVKWSPAQIAHRQRVRAAAAYYRTVLADPALKKKYTAVARRRGIPLSAVTLAAFLKRPTSG